jgi:hypothetical protein
MQASNTKNGDEIYESGDAVFYLGPEIISHMTLEAQGGQVIKLCYVEDGLTDEDAIMPQLIQ